MRTHSATKSRVVTYVATILLSVVALAAAVFVLKPNLKQFVKPTLGVIQSAQQKVVVKEPTLTLPAVPNIAKRADVPRPLGTISGSSFVSPGREFQLEGWAINIPRLLVFRDQQVVIEIRSTAKSPRRLQSVNATFVQMELTPETGLGWTDTFSLYDNGTHGDVTSNDGIYTTTISPARLYGDVYFNSFTVVYSDTSQETIRPSSVAFVVEPTLSTDAVVHETAQAIGIAPRRWRNAAIAFSRGVDLCYPDLQRQMGEVSFWAGKAVYRFRARAGYLETGSIVNTVYLSDTALSSIDLNGGEWSSCNPITSHELVHSTFVETRMPIWFNEGLAEYTSRKIAGTLSTCSSDGWTGTDGIGHRYSPLLPWIPDFDHYQTAVCVVKYLEDTYGASALQNTYRSLRAYRSNEVQRYCDNPRSSPSYNFYRDILRANTDTRFETVLQSRFGLSSEETQCRATP